MIDWTSQKANDVLFICFVVQSLSRKTENPVSRIVEILGYKNLSHYYELADVYHCYNPDGLFQEIIEKYRIEKGTLDNVAKCLYRVPTPMDIAKVFQRLILSVADLQNTEDVISVLVQVYSSDFSDKIENYNSSLYFENPGCVLYSYLHGCE